MIAVEDAQKQSDLLTSLIDQAASAPDPNAIRPQIKEEALSLHSMELSLVGPAETQALEKAAADLDALIDWNIYNTAAVRPTVINASKSAQPIIELGLRICGWTHAMGTTTWQTQPEVAAAALPSIS